MNFEYYLEEGKRYLSRNRIDEAYTVLEKALGLEPENEYALFELGNIYARKNNHEEAVRNYRRAIEINPEFINPRLELGKVLKIQGRIEQAEHEFRFVADNSHASESRIESLYELAMIYRLYSGPENLKDKRKVLDELQKNIGSSKKNIKYNMELGKLYRTGGQRNKAEDIFKGMLSLPEIKCDKFLHNKVLNELEITQGREVLESKVRSMVAMIINRCNLRCRMCGIWNTEWQVRDAIMREIVDLFPYLEDINWEGGEVFMMRGFRDILKEGVKYKNLKQIIYTNGLMLNEKIMDILDKGKVDIVFSIDGVSKQTYEYIRRGGNFDKLEKVLSMVKEFRKDKGRNIKLYLNPVIMKTNYRELEGFVDFAGEYGFDVVTFHPIRGQEFGDENIFHLRNEQALNYLTEVMPAVEKKADERGIRLNNWLPLECEQERKSAGQEPGKNEVNTDDIICYAPWQRMVLDNEGQMRPHVFCLNKWVGDSRKMSLKDIWNGPGMREYRKKIARHDYTGLCQPECISGRVRENTLDVI